LAQNAGRAINRVPVGQAEVGVRVSRLGTRKQELNTLNTVAQAYWNLVGQLEIVSVNEDAVKLSERLLRDNRVRLQAGTISSADVLASETQLARDRQSLLQARLVALNLEDQLRQAIGLESVDFGIKPGDVPALREANFDPADQIDRVYRNNPDLASLQASLESNGYDLQTAENAAKPQLNLALSYIFNGYSKDPLAGSAYYAQTQTQGYAATLNYTLPLFDKVGPANIQRRLLERQALDLQIRDQRTQLNILLQSALRNIRQAREQVSTARTAMDLARVQLQNEIDKLAQGRSTAFLVAQLQQQLSQAQQLEIAARVQFEQNDSSRRTLTGELYSHFGLQSSALDAQ
jgi:outer membrane protein TolC